AFLLNATLRSLDAKAMECLAAFDGIWVRESASRDLLARRGVPSKVTPDLTVVARHEKGVAPEGVCGTDSVLVDVSRQIRSLCQQNKWQFRSMLWKTKPWAHEYVPDETRLQRVHEFSRFLSAHDFVITGRFHTVTMCIATHTPFIAVESNTDKIS